MSGRPQCPYSRDQKPSQGNTLEQVLSQALKADLYDIESEFQQEREGLLESIRMLHRDVKLQKIVIQNFAYILVVNRKVQQEERMDLPIKTI